MNEMGLYVLSSYFYNKDVDMKYVVTYCASDREAGSNPLWHSSILLSKLDEEKKLLEVIDNWGFYGVPTTQRDNSWSSRLKIKIGLDVDLKGNHGILRHEELRFLDLGRGLHGVSFELTKEQFELLQTKCQEMVRDQNAAISEVVDTQGLAGKPQEKTRIYAHEHLSTLIYSLEKLKAEQNKREPRLKPFELILSWGLTGPGLHHSYTCKSQVLALLSHVLSPEQIDRLTEGGKHPTIPRYSGPMESFSLHSTGPLRQHKKASGEVVHYRDFKDHDVKLYWTVPPQELEALSQDTIDLFQIDDEYCDEVKKLVRRLQHLEWFLRNVSAPVGYEQYKAGLIAQIIDAYKAFSIIEPKQISSTLPGWKSFAYSLFSWPRNDEEKSLKMKIRNAKMLFNSLYMAIVDNWRIEDNQIETVEGSTQEKEGEDLKSSTFEAFVAYLPEQDQKYLCRILGRTYVKDDSLSETEEDEEENGIELSAAIS